MTRKSNTILASNWTAIISVILVIIGFRLVTQANQGYVIQNDGYAGSGGLLILVGGIILGLYLAAKGFSNGKSSK